MNLFTSLILAISVTLCSIVNAGLVGHWAVDENTQNSVVANDGLWTCNTTYISGRIGNARQFDGLGYVSIPSVPAYQFGVGAFSVALWMKFDALRGNSDGFLHKDDYGADGSSAGWLFNCDILGGGLVWNTPAGQNAPARQSPIASFVLDTGDGFIGVRRGYHVSFYIDGQLPATATSASPINVNPNADLDIDALGSGDRQYFKGAVDEARLYDHALSGPEIDVVADVPEASTYSSMIGLLRWRRGS